MTDALLTVLTDPGLARTLGMAAKERVSQRYLIGKVADRDMAVYQEVLYGECAATAVVGTPGQEEL